MKIVLTGSSGHLGSALVNQLALEHEVILLGRGGNQISWKLGLAPEVLDLKEIGAIVHLAWSTHDRALDWHNNVGGTLRLAQFAQKNNVPLLFISSVTATSQSYYGRAKLEAEFQVLNCGGYVLRIGLVPGHSYIQMNSRKTYLRFIPDLDLRVRVTYFNELKSFIDSWLISPWSSRVNKPITIVSATPRFIDFMRKNSLVTVRVNVKLATTALVFLGRISRTARNRLDSLESLLSTVDSN